MNARGEAGLEGSRKLAALPLDPEQKPWKINFANRRLEKLN